MHSQPLTPERLRELLPPERSVFRFDEVRLTGPGRSAVGLLHPEADAPYICGGHIPGVFSIQMSVDMGFLIARSHPDFADSSHLLLGVNHARFYKEILPGSTVEIRTGLTARREDKPILSFESEIFADGERAAVTNIALYLM